MLNIMILHKLQSFATQTNKKRKLDTDFSIADCTKASAAEPTNISKVLITLESAFN